jgi:hypothetical protein
VTVFRQIRKFLAVLCLLQASLLATAAQEPAVKPAERSILSFQIQLLETRVRFEANGDSRKEVHTVVKLNNILGAQEFARLAFDYNRAFQQLEIPQVRITHANGGTSEVLPSAISDAPNPAGEKYPAYQDVRVKSVRLLGLQEGDTVEYRVTTTTTHHPLAPDFWLEHSFDRSGQVLEEVYELDLPTSRAATVRTSEDSQSFEEKKSTEGAEPRILYVWKHSVSPNEEKKPEKVTARSSAQNSLPSFLTEGDLAVTTFANWPRFMVAIQKFFPYERPAAPGIKDEAMKLTAVAKTSEARLRMLYEFVAQKVVTVDLPLSATGLATRMPQDILATGYGTPEDKCTLLISLARAIGLPAQPALTGPAASSVHGPVVPSLLTSVLVFAPNHEPRVRSPEGVKATWMDPSEPVTPFGMIAANLRGKSALLPFPQNDTQFFKKIPQSLPFAAFQRVGVDAKLSESGDLTAKVNYALRGDNELLLRVAFHQTPKEKWKEVASLLAISDGFRGQVTSVKASEPMATREPFAVEYELSQPKFVDWSKKPVRIPALLPQIGLPEPPTKLTEDGKKSNIELGTPLNVETQLTLRLPPGTKAEAPAGTSVARDYASYVSKYSVTTETLTASRHINFLLREVTAERSVDYSAFLHAVQNDQAQQVTLVPAVNSDKNIKH